jgi:hypothetical protein
MYNNAIIINIIIKRQKNMNMNKIISGFFFILAMTINFGFFYGDPTILIEHSAFELFAAIVINLIATVLKLGDKTQLGSVLLATSLVADIQLIASATIWALADYVFNDFGTEAVVAIISLSGGALLANIVSVILFIGDTIKSKR